MNELRDAWLGVKSDLDDLYAVIREEDMSDDARAEQTASLDSVLNEIDFALGRLVEE